MRAAGFFLLTTLAVLLAGCDNRTAVEEANEKGILLIGNADEPQGLDPQMVSGVLESNIIGSLFEGLCVNHPSKDGVALPGAAVSWEGNEDSSEWTFHLRPDAKWSDGVPVTARDFLFTYQRLLTPALGAEYASMLYYIEGAEAYHKGETTDFSTVKVSAPDDFTLKVKLRGSLPFLPEITKHYTWFPVPRHVVLKYGKIEDPFTEWTEPGNLVGNGPFRLKSWRLNDHIEVDRNPHYWDREKVSLNGIRFLPLTNYYTEARMFFNGQLHVTYTLPPELIPYAEEHYPKNVRSELYLGTVFLRCNVTRKPLDNPTVRRALALAIDRQSIIDNILQGGQKEAYGMVPPTEGYNTPHGVEFDPEKARALLAEAGFSDPADFPVLKILTADREISKRLAEAYQAMWKEHLGIRMEIEQKEWTTYLVAMKELEYDLGAGGWIGDYLDPTTFLDMWIKDGGNNRTGWGNAEFEALLKESEHISDPAARYRTLEQAEAILLQELPALPIYWYTTNYLIDTCVKGWNPLLLNHHPYKFLTLEPGES